jgi:hypothetical protein
MMQILREQTEGAFYRMFGERLFLDMSHKAQALLAAGVGNNPFIAGMITKMVASAESPVRAPSYADARAQVRHSIEVSNPERPFRVVRERKLGEGKAELIIE